MSEEKKPEAAGESGGGSKLPVIVALVNTLAVLAAGGVFVYTKVLYKRPSITEESERKRLEEEQAKPKAPVVPGLVSFDPVTVNIEPNPSQPRPADGTSRQIQGKQHYATVGFSLEIRDIGQKGVVEKIRPILMDELLNILAKKPFHELTSVQGRYVLRSQLLDLANHLTAKLPSYHVEPAPAKAEGGHGGGGHGGGGEHGGGHGGGGGHGEEKKAAAPAEADGPPIAALFREGLVSNVFFSQFIVQ